jgi:hypothetical protein
MNVQTTSSSRPARVRPERDERVLHRVGGRPDEPDHQVGVGAEADRRVHAPNGHLRLPLLDQVLDLLRRVVHVEVAEPRVALQQTYSA